MSHRFTAATAASFLIGLPALIIPATTDAQTASAPSAVQLQSLGLRRARSWAATAPVIHCAPAPLTERPTATSEYARPSVVPLETAFLDAAAVKRTLAAANGDNRRALHGGN